MAAHPRAYPAPRKRRFPTRPAAVAAAVTALGGGALAIGADNDRTPPPPSPSQQQRDAADKARAMRESELRVKTEAVTARQTAVVAELERRQAATDRVPSQVRRSLGGGNEHGVNVALARRVSLSQAGAAWVAPGEGKVCLITLDPTGAQHGFGLDCGSPEAVADGQVAATWIAGEDASGTATVIGLAPNGVTEVTITDRDGSEQRVPVRHNVYIAEGAHPRAASFRTSTGLHVKRL